MHAHHDHARTLKITPTTGSSSSRCSGRSPTTASGRSSRQPAQLKLVVDSIVWAFRHTERNIAETGLNLLLEMTKYFQVSEFCNQFHQSFYLSLVQEIFAVMTDGFHKPGFKLHALLLQNLFCARGERPVVGAAVGREHVGTRRVSQQRSVREGARVEAPRHLVPQHGPGGGSGADPGYVRLQGGSDHVQEPPP